MRITPRLFGLFGISVLVAITLVLSFGTADVARAQTVDTHVVIISEEARLIRLEALLDQLVLLLEQLYPQIDWSALIGGDDDDEESQDDDNGDNDDDEDSDEDDDEDDDEDEDDDDEPTAISPVGSNNARADFVIPLTLSSFGNDLYIEKSAVRNATISSGDGVTYVIEDGSGATYTGGSASAAFTSNSESGDTSGYFKMDEDETREFILSITLDNNGGTEGFYRARIVGIAFDNDASAGGETTQSLSSSIYRTPAVFVDDAN